MSFLRKILRGGNGSGRTDATSSHKKPVTVSDSKRYQLLGGGVDLNVVGESFRQENLWRQVGRRHHLEDRVRVDVCAVLEPETGNPHDPNAVSVWVDDHKVGYLSRDDARQYRPGLLTLQREYGRPIALHGVIAGGGIREDGPGLLGVFLDHDPADFGLQARSVSLPVPRMRTGLTDVAVHDGADGTHHLDWMRDLPEDDIRAITMLRKLLEKRTDPLDRHFMYTQLETLLYKSRDAFGSALDDYDQACIHHDAEMDDIRHIFITRWGDVPVLETYRQMAIRQQKAADFKQALWWAERGISVYGNEAARPEAVEDLRRRAAAYKAKLTPALQPPYVPVPTSEQPEIETLRCVVCRRDFQRNRVRGRKPTRCPECAGKDGSGNL